MKRWLCLALTLALCCGSILGVVPALAEADEAVSAPVDPAVELADGELGMGLFLENGDEPMPEADGDLPSGPEPEENSIESNAAAVAAPADAAGVTVNATDIAIGVREQYRALNAVVTNDAGAPVDGAAVVWSSSEPAVVRVNAETGAITGVKPGAATVYASAGGEITTAVNVTVGSAPKSVALTPERPGVTVGGHCRLLPEVDEGAACGAFTFEALNADLAAIDENGVVTGLQRGEAAFTATAYNGKRAELVLNVYAPPAAIAAAQGEYVISQNGQGRIEVLATDAEGGSSVAEATFEIDAASADPGCIALDPLTGVVTGLRKGEAVVRVNCGELTDTCAVVVNGAPADMTLTPSDVTIGVKEVYTGVKVALIPAEGETEAEAVVTWRSENEKVAKVDAATGAITGVKAGASTTIYAATDSGIERAVSVKVMRAPKKVTVTPETLRLGPGAMRQLLPTTDKNTASGAFTYVSSAPGVASVDESGVVTGVSKGTATITVKSFNGKTAACQATVLNAPTTIGFKTEPFLMATGMSCAIPVDARDADGDEAMAGYAWTSDHPEIVSFDEFGNAVAHAQGTATVTAATGSLSATCRVEVVPAPADMRLNESAINIGLKETCPAVEVTLVAPAGAEGCASDITWRSSNAKTVAVDAETGALTGLKRGSATVTATTINGIERSMTVKVIKAPTAVTVSPATLPLSEGMTDKLTPDVKKGSACRAYTYVSSNPAVARVDDKGNVTGVQKGTATITVRTFNGKSATCQVTVYGPPASVRAEECKLVAGMTRAIDAQALDAAGDYTPAGLTFEIDASSADPGCIQLDAQTGDVTGVRRGEATVRVTANGGATGVCTVRVLAAPVDMSLGVSSVAVCVKEVYAMPEPVLTPPDGETDCQAEITWRSDNAKIAKVDPETGAITGVKAGTTTVTAATHNGIERKVTVKVGKAPTKVTFKPKAYTVEAGESIHLVPTLNKNAVCGSFTYRSSDSSVAVVTDEGWVTGVSAGTATITATTYNNKSGSCTVTVTGSAAPANVTVSPAALSIAIGTSWKLSASADAKTDARGYTWQSSDSGVATVASDGTVRAASKGTATITASAYNGATGSCAVTVIGAPAQVFLDTERVELSIGASRKLTATVMDESGASGYANCTFKVLEGAGVVSVDGSGSVTALSAGTAVIGVSAPNGVDSHVDLPTGGSVQTRCAVVVSDGGSVARVELPQTMSVQIGETVTVKPVLYGSDGKVVIGSCAMTLTGDAARLDGDQLTGVKAGVAVLSATAAGGASATCTVTVGDQQRYRFFGAYEYSDKNVKGVLYFSKNNVESVWSVLSRTSIDGASYEKTNIMANPSKSELLSGLKSAFADSADGDVNVVYLCSHGYNYIDVASSKPMHYGLQLPGYSDYKSDSKYYVTAEELFSAVSAIRGRVVLILDSCFSGVFIDNMRSKLDAEGGRISVLCAATDTKASYYTTKNMSDDFDFFTYYMLYGVNYDMMKHQFGVGWDADSNNNGEITVSELFSYAKTNVTSYLPGFDGKSWFYGNPAQTPTWYAGGNGDLVICKR